MPTILSHLTRLLSRKAPAQEKDEKASKLKELATLGVTAEMLQAGVEALRAYEPLDPYEVKTTVVDETVPPPEALPLLAAICDSNYQNDVTYMQELLKPYEFQLRDVRREHIHGSGLFSGKRHVDGDEQHDKAFAVPYVRVWYLPPNKSTVTKDELSEESKKAGWVAQEYTLHTGGLIIVSFTGSTTGADWLDDFKYFTHVSGSFLHPDLEGINTHHGFADWLNRRLDTKVKLTTTADQAGTSDPFTPQSTDQKVENTVFNATCRAIADLRRNNKYEGSGPLKMFVTGHSLGGAVASLFSLRIAAAAKYDMTDTFLHNALYLNPDSGSHGDRGLSARLTLAVTFGAPRSLWHGTTDEFKVKREAYVKAAKLQAEAEAKNAILPPQNTGYQPYVYRPDLSRPPRIEDTPIARVVMQRDPVPHVPPGAGELPSGLNVLKVQQIPEANTVALESEGPQAGEGAQTDGISIPVEDGPNTYVHVGHQWVLGGKEPLEQLASKSDKYIADAWALFKDLVTHNPWNNNIAAQHVMNTYLKHVAEVYHGLPPKA